jgi:adenosylcobinamide-GDP ribazoletransferase
VDLLVTGGLHLDGLADEADGIASRLPPAEAAAVMRAGPVGAIGAGAAAIVLLLRFALLSTLFAGPLSLAVAAVAIPAAGRFCMVWAMATTRPRRDSAPRRGDRAGLIRALGTPEPGGGPVTRELAVPHGPKGTHAGSLASEMRGAARGLPLLVSGTVTVVSSYLLAGLRGLAGLACACLVASVNAWFAGRRVGGVTGDVVGAGGLLGETVMLAAAAIHL